MGHPQIIRTEGEDLIVLPRSDYDALLARAGDEAGEDVMTARVLNATDEKITRGANRSWLWQRLLRSQLRCS